MRKLIVQIYPDEFVIGLNKIGEQCPLLETATLYNALNERWPGGQLMSQYLIVHKESFLAYEEQIRLKKATVNLIDQHGLTAVIRMLAFDFDLPGKPKHTWNDDYMIQIQDAWAQTTIRYPMLGQYHAWYTTPGGFRVVYMLKEAFNYTDVEPYIQGVLSLFQSTTLGAFVDDSCCDWTRLFRLPRINRNGSDTDLLPYYTLEINEDAPLFDLRNVAPALTVGKANKYGPINRVDREGLRIGPDEAKALLRTPEGKRTEWLIRALRQLKNRDVLDFISCAKRIESAGTRNTTLLKLVGSTIGFLYRVMGTSPTLVFAIWCDAVEQMQARTGTDDGKDWIDILWEMVCRCWEKEESQVAVKDAEVVATTQKEVKLNELVIDGMRKWCKHPYLFSSESDASLFVQRHAIASFGNGIYHCLRADGYYDVLPINLTNLPARIRELGMDSVVEIVRQVEDKTVPVPPQQLISRHATFITNREGAVGIEGSFIRDIESDAATYVFKMYERDRSIFPRFHKCVDEWLRALAETKENYDTITNWIGHALNFEGGPIAALSINGPPGIGKKLLYMGLAECINTKTIATAKEMTGRFQSQLLKTAFMLINEGLPIVGRDAAVDPADAFRGYVGGDPIHIEQKGQGIIVIRNAIRVLILGNNDEILKTLYRHRDLSISDREALGLRLIHLTVGNGGTEWLRKMGGYDYTARMGAKWIAGDDGSASNNIVAEHFTYLYNKRLPVPVGNRLLVEGSVNGPLIRDMAVSSGGSPEIIEVVLSMLDNTQTPPGLQVEDGNIYVTATGVRDHYMNMPQRNMGLRLNLQRIASVLKGLALAGYDEETTAEGHKLKWYLLDMDILASLASQYGNRCKKLHQLLKDRDARRKAFRGGTQGLDRA